MRTRAEQLAQEAAFRAFMDMCLNKNVRQAMLTTKTGVIVSHMRNRILTAIHEAREDALEAAKKVPTRGHVHSREYAALWDDCDACRALKARKTVRPKRPSRDHRIRRAAGEKK